MSGTLEFKPKGVCSSLITIIHENGIVKDVAFLGGCRGNTLGISALIRGMSIGEAIIRLRGIQCRNGTSCPDQLAIALESIN